MNEAVASLTSAGLLTRKEDPQNRRILLADLTQAGSTVLAVCEKEVDRVEEMLLKDMVPHDVKELRRLMRQTLSRVRQTV